MKPALLEESRNVFESLPGLLVQGCSGHPISSARICLNISYFTAWLVAGILVCLYSTSR